MPFRSFAVFGLAVITCGACSGCHTEYQATGMCESCTGDDEFPVTGYWKCTESEAETALIDVCPSGEIVGTITYKERFAISLLSDCDDRTTPLPDAVRDLIRQAGQRAGLTREHQATDGPTCPPQLLDLKVTVFLDVGNSDCPGQAQEVQILYLKDDEFVTLSQVVPVGGNHEFICTDAAVNHLGKMATFRVAVGSGCSCTIEEGCYFAQAFSQVPADGSSVVCRANADTNELNPTVIPPPANTTAPQQAVPSATRRELLPIPDPMFSPR